MRQALALDDQAIGRLGVAQGQRVGEEGDTGPRNLAEVILDLTRHHHVRRQLDAPASIAAEDEVEW